MQHKLGSVLAISLLIPFIFGGGCPGDENPVSGQASTPISSTPPITTNFSLAEPADLVKLLITRADTMAPKPDFSSPKKDEVADLAQLSALADGVVAVVKLADTDVVKGIFLQELVALQATHEASLKSAGVIPIGKKNPTQKDLEAFLTSLQAKWGTLSKTKNPPTLTAFRTAFAALEAKAKKRGISTDVLAAALAAKSPLDGVDTIDDFKNFLNGTGTFTADKAFNSTSLPAVAQFLGVGLVVFGEGDANKMGEKDIEDVIPGNGKDYLFVMKTKTSYQLIRDGAVDVFNVDKMSSYSSEVQAVLNAVVKRSV